MGRNSLGPRPLDYYGPEDYYNGQDVREAIERVKEKQDIWDTEREKLPWWRKIFR